MLGPMPSDDQAAPVSGSAVPGAASPGSASPGSASPGAADPALAGRDYGEVLWEPRPEAIDAARVSAYARWLADRCLGAKVEAYDANGNPVTGAVGELVLTRPMPSMPVGFWNDPGGERYRASYFAEYPGVWRHGDWIMFLPDGGCVIYGRSDATLNRGGVRMGTSEFYRVVERLPEVADPDALANPEVLPFFAPAELP